VITVPAGVSDFDYPISLPPWMEIGRTSRSVVMAIGEVSDPDGTKHKVSFTSLFEYEQIVAIVDPGQLSLDLERQSVTAAPGKSAELRLRVGRGTGVTGDIRIELIVPALARGVSAEAVTIPAASDAGTLALRFDSADAGPFNMPLIVRAKAVRGDQTPVIAEAHVEIVSRRD
jgi:hypothetical protein